jgi:glycosyltransferase involved in cell wall biosynthesis
MASAVEDAIRQFSPDIAYAYHLRMAPYLERAKGIYRVMDLTDSVSLFLRRMLRHRPLYLRPLIWREARSVQRYEEAIGARFEEVWLISRQDMAAIRGASRWKNLVLIPNGVDTEYFCPAQRRDSGDGAPLILFVGFMGAESAVSMREFCRNLFPAIRERVPGVQLKIVGRTPSKGIRRLAEDPQVQVAGYVPDLKECYQRATVSIAPMKFVTGMQNKILEAMACGVPVVSTSMANEGIGAAPGEEILVADRDGEFADAVCSLLVDPGKRGRMSEKARRFVLRNFRWERVAEHVGALGASGRVAAVNRQ